MNISTRPRPSRLNATRARTTPGSRRLVIMVKEPRAGRVKTRLASDVGTIAATYFYRHMANAVIRRLSANPQWQTWLAITPDASLHSSAWPGNAGRKQQGRGDLGNRMQTIMRWSGAGPVIIVGTDIPAIEPNHIADAFRTLAGHGAVFGPTPDGGYWLVGLARTPRIERPFKAVRWSTEHALADTRANLDPTTTRLVTCLEDIDNGSQWQRVRASAGRVVQPLRTTLP